VQETVSDTSVNCYCVLWMCQTRDGDSMNVSDVPIAELDLPVSLRVPGLLISFLFSVSATWFVIIIVHNNDLKTFVLFCLRAPGYGLTL